MRNELKLPNYVRLASLVFLALLVARCGVEQTSEVQAIKGKEVFRIQAKKSILESQIPGAFAALEPIRSTVSSVVVSTTTELLGVEIVPVVNADVAQIDVVATIKSNNIFDVETANIGTIGRGQTDGKGRKSIMIDANGIRSAGATFDGKTVITSVDPILGTSFFDFAKNAAAKLAATQFTAKQAETEKEVYAKVGQAVGIELNKKIDPTVLKTNEHYQNYFFKPFYATNRFPAYLNFETTADSVIVNGSSEKYGMSVVDRSAVAEHDLSFQLHESFVNSFFQRNIKTYRPMKIEDVKALIASMPIDAVKFTALETSMSEKVKDVRLNFGYGTPVALSIADNLITFTIRASFSGAIVALNNAVITSPALEAKVAYRIALDATNTLSLKRELVELKQIDDKPVDTAMQSLVKPAMEKIFKELVAIPNIPMKKASGEISHLHPTAVASQGGWLNIVWKIVAGTAPTGAPTLDAGTTVPGPGAAPTPGAGPTPGADAPTLDTKFF